MRGLLLLCLLTLMMNCQKNVMANFDIHIENSDKYDNGVTICTKLKSIRMGRFSKF